MKKYSAKDYIVAVLVLLPLPVIWFLLFSSIFPGSLTAGIIIIGTTITYICLLGVIVFKRLPKKNKN